MSYFYTSVVDKINYLLRLLDLNFVSLYFFPTLFILASYQLICDLFLNRKHLVIFCLWPILRSPDKWPTSS